MNPRNATAAACLMMLTLAFLTTLRATAIDSRTLTELWVKRLAATMQEHASAADVDRLLELYADDAVYEHPHANARIDGKTALREGICSHLGETRALKLRVKQTLSGEGFAVIEFTVDFELRQDEKWLPMHRRQVVVFEFRGERIQRIIDHWARQ
jgi:ketosteroid isomerase-like protein